MVMNDEKPQVRSVLGEKRSNATMFDVESWEGWGILRSKAGDASS